MKLPVLFAVLTALCWGLYGPVLGYSRAALGHSPFKPYCAIGVAYLIWGVFGGLVGMHFKGDSFSFSGPGVFWGLAGGTLGAWGAFALTLAMFSGGGAMPHIVMPIVFGGAVTVSALYSFLTLSSKVPANPLLWVGVAGILVSTVIVAANTPSAPPPAKAAKSAVTHE